MVQAHDTPIRQLQWQPRSYATEGSLDEKSQQIQILASCGQSKSIGIWSLDNSSPNPTITLIHNLSSHSSSISKISFSPDGKFIASGSYRKLYIWRVDDGFLSYIYDAISLKDSTLTNGDMNGTQVAKSVPAKHANGDVEMGGMEDGDADGDNDSGKGGLDLFDISEISWECGGKRVAAAMAGVGVCALSAILVYYLLLTQSQCIIIPIVPKTQTPPRQNSPIIPALPSTSAAMISDKTAFVGDGTAKASSTTVISVETNRLEMAANGIPVEVNGSAALSTEKSALR